MNNRIGIFALGLLLTAVRAGALSQDQERVLTDDFGHAFILPENPPRRIISLAPNITEILFAVGAGEQIAGVTRYCDYPAAARGKDRVGGFIDPSVEMILHMNPDLVIAFRGNPIRTLERLRGLGLPLFVFDIGTDLDTLPGLIEKIAVLVGREEAAARLAGDIRTDLDAAARKIAARPDRPSVFLTLNARGLWTCGRDSYLDDVLTRAGGRNIAGELRRNWVHFSRERLFSDNPEVVVIMAASFEDFQDARDRLAREYRLDGLRAFRTDRVCFLEEDAASRFGPRLVETLKALAACLHPGLTDGGERP